MIIAIENRIRVLSSSHYASEAMARRELRSKKWAASSYRSCVTIVEAIAIALMGFSTVGNAQGLPSSSTTSSHALSFTLYALSDGSQHGTATVVIEDSTSLAVDVVLLHAGHSSTYSVEIVYSSSDGLTQVPVGSLTTNPAGYASFHSGGVQFPESGGDLQIVLLGAQVYLTPFQMLGN